MSEIAEHHELPPEHIGPVHPAVGKANMAGLRLAGYEAFLQQTIEVALTRNVDIDYLDQLQAGRDRVDNEFMALDEAAEPFRAEEASKVTASFRLPEAGPEDTSQPEPRRDGPDLARARYQEANSKCLQWPVL